MDEGSGSSPLPLKVGNINKTIRQTIPAPFSFDSSRSFFPPSRYRCQLHLFNRIGQQKRSDVGRTSVTQPGNTATARQSHLISGMVDVVEGPYENKGRALRKMQTLN